MTREEAQDALKQGHKITHYDFSDDEWIQERDHKMYDEKGYELGAYTFWRYRDSPRFDNGWSIYKK